MDVNLQTLLNRLSQIIEDVVDGTVPVERAQAAVPLLELALAGATTLENKRADEAGDPSVRAMRAALEAQQHGERLMLKASAQKQEV